MSDPIDHISEGLARVITEYKSKSRFNGFLVPMLNEVQCVEDEALLVEAGRDLDTATGAGLDLLGKLVGQGRLGFEDEDYRTLIRVRIEVNSSNGHPDEIISVLKFFLEPLGVVWTYDEIYPASIFVFIEDPGDLSIGFITRIVLAIKPSGVGGGVMTAPPEADRFYYDGGLGYASDADAEPRIGGGYAGLTSS